jgi:hypothetical protein
MQSITLITTLLIVTLTPAFGRGRSSGYHSHGTYHSRTYSSHSYHRGRAARADFQRSHPCPATGRTSGACPGYVVDHVKPLACGGADGGSWSHTRLQQTFGRRKEHRNDFTPEPGFSCI